MSGSVSPRFRHQAGTQSPPGSPECARHRRKLSSGDDTTTAVSNISSGSGSSGGGGGDSGTLSVINILLLPL
jgi:hypothetical protein